MTAATKKQFGDYQCNAALPLAKKLGKKPRDIADASTFQSLAHP